MSKVSFWSRIVSWFSERQDEPEGTQTGSADTRRLSVSDNLPLPTDATTITRDQTTGTSTPDMYTNLQTHLKEAKRQRQDCHDLKADVTRRQAEADAMHVKLVDEMVDAPDFHLINEAMERLRATTSETVEMMDRQIAEIDQRIAQVTRDIHKLDAGDNIGWPDLSHVPRKAPPPPGDADAR